MNNKYEVHGVIHFQQAEGHANVENHQQLCLIYNNGITAFRDWIKQFRERHTNLYDEEGNREHSIESSEPF